MHAPRIFLKDIIARWLLLLAIVFAALLCQSQLTSLGLFGSVLIVVVLHCQELLLRDYLLL